MGFDGTGLFVGLLLIAVWLVAVVAMFALLAMRRTPTTDAVWWVSLVAQVAMLVRAAQVGLLPLAALCLVAIAAGALVRRRWAAGEYGAMPT